MSEVNGSRPGDCFACSNRATRSYEVTLWLKPIASVSLCDSHFKGLKDAGTVFVRSDGEEEDA